MELYNYKKQIIKKLISAAKSCSMVVEKVLKLVFNFTIKELQCSNSCSSIIFIDNLTQIQQVNLALNQI